MSSITNHQDYDSAGLRQYIGDFVEGTQKYARSIIIANNAEKFPIVKKVLYVSLVAMTYYLDHLALGRKEEMPQIDLALKIPLFAIIAGTVGFAVKNILTSKTHYQIFNQNIRSTIRNIDEIKSYEKCDLKSHDAHFVDFSKDLAQLTIKINKRNISQVYRNALTDSIILLSSSLLGNAVLNTGHLDSMTTRPVFLLTLIMSASSGLDFTNCDNNRDASYIESITKILKKDLHYLNHLNN